MQIHFIAIGGAVMHNLALALQAAGHTVTGSDDAIHDPSKTRLQDAGLYPDELGWHPGRIHEDLDAVILGKHARLDNPELVKAQKMKLKIYSFPAFIRSQAQNKQRIIIAGSHGKSSITAMLMHILKTAGLDFDYLVGTQVAGFERMVRLSNAPVILVEGDEYPTSALDSEPKFLHYEPHICVVSGIAWDHINAFPTEREYVAQFEKLLKSLPKAATCIYNKDDKQLRDLVKAELEKDTHYTIPYTAVSAKTKGDQTMVKIDKKRVAFPLFGKHNLENLSAAIEVARQLAVRDEAIMRAIETMPTPAMRLQVMYEDTQTVVIRDFAHAPSKLAASVEAVQSRYGKTANIIVAFELHTYSSMNKDFLPQYRGVLKKLNNKIVYIDNKALEIKRMEPLTAGDIHTAFGDDGIQFADTVDVLQKQLLDAKADGIPNVFLLASSGHFGGLDFDTLT